MRFNFKTLLTTSLLSISAVHGASSPAVPMKEGQEFKHDFTMGLESFHYKYSEETPEQKNFMNHKAIMYGIHGAYQLTYKNTFFVNPETRWAYGHADYDSCDGEKSKIAHIPSLIFETRLLIGISYQSTSQLAISPYTGIGYRYKQDDSSNMKNRDNIEGYKRINKLWYVPLGIRFKYNLTDQWHVQGMVEHDFLIQGKQYSYMKDYIPSPVINRQKQGFGLRGELLIGRQFEKISLAVGPYVNYWKIKESKDTSMSLKEDNGRISHGRFLEPKNTTTELGLKFNIKF